MRPGPCIHCGQRTVEIILPLLLTRPAIAGCRACGFTLELPGPAKEWEAARDDRVGEA
jgi:hypothetical protein